MKRYESRYCTFAVPDDWEATPPFLFVGKDESGGRLTAQTLEFCLLVAMPAQTYLRQQKEILPDLYEGFELLTEVSHCPEGLGEGFTLTFRFLDEEENHSRAQSIYLIFGPIACQLVLASLDRPDRERDRLFAAIIKTFVLRQVEFLAKAQPMTLTSEILRAPQLDSACAWTSPWRKFPRACVSLPIPSGWEVADAAGDVLLRRGAAEIRLHRDLEGHSDPGAWFSDRLKSLQDTGDLLLASESGEIERGSFASVLYEEEGETRTWRTAVASRCLEIFISSQQRLLWTLKGPGADFSGHRSALESLIAVAKFIDPGEWETRLVEPWLDYTLKGPWQMEAAGIYVFLSDPLEFIMLNREPTKASTETLSQSIKQSLKAEVNLQAGSAERDLRGPLAHYPSFQYSLEGISRTGKRETIRVLGSIAEGTYFCIITRGSTAVSLFPGLVLALKKYLEADQSME